jgi:hypothetical protein
MLPTTIRTESQSVTFLTRHHHCVIGIATPPARFSQATSVFAVMSCLLWSLPARPSDYAAPSLIRPIWRPVSGPRPRFPRVSSFSSCLLP